MILGVHHVSLLCSDLERARSFYGGILGLQEDPERPDLGYAGAWYRLGGLELHLICLPNPCSGVLLPEHGGRDRHLALAVDELDPLAERLERAGVTCTRSRSGRRALFCRDPDGNALEFVEAGGQGG